MRQKRKIVSLIICLIMMFSLIPATSYAEISYSEATNADEITITINKVWNDSEIIGVKGYERPSSVKFVIQGTVDGAEEGSPVTLTIKGDSTVSEWSESVTLPGKTEEGKDITYIVKEEEIPGYTSEETNHSITVVNEAQDPIYDNRTIPAELTIKKVDAETGKPLAGASFQFWDEDPATAYYSSVPGTVTDANGVMTYSLYREGTFWVKEYGAPAGYDKENVYHKVVVSKSDDYEQVYEDGKFIRKYALKIDSIDGKTFSADNSVLEVKDEPNGGVVTLTVKKVDDVTGEPISGVHIYRYKNTSTWDKVRYVTDSNGEIKYTFTTTGTWTIKEERAAKGYEYVGDDKVKFTVKITKDSSGRLNASYSTSSDQISFEGNTATIKNHKSAAVVRILKYDAETFEPLAGASFAPTDCNINMWPRSDSNGEVYYAFTKEGTHYIQEAGAPAGYTKDSSMYKVVVKRDQTTGELYISKSASDFYYGKVKSSTFSRYWDLSGEYPTLSVYNSPDSSSEEDGSNTLRIIKQWDDDNNSDGARPESLTVTVHITYQFYDDWTWEYYYEYEDYDVTLTGDATAASWSKDVPLNPSYSIYDTFVTVEETSVPKNYQLISSNISLWDSDNRIVANVKNSYVTEYTKINVSKQWVDSYDLDGTRPDSIVVKAVAKNKATGEIVDSLTEEAKLDSSNSWSYKFTNLVKSYVVDGETVDLEWDVAETSVEGYETSYTWDSSRKNCKITNSHTPDTKSIIAKKEWDDSKISQNEGYNRPTSTDLFLEGYVGEEIVYRIKKSVSDDNDWTAVFDDVPATYKGETVIYKIVEKEVIGFVPIITKHEYTIENTPNVVKDESLKDADLVVRKTDINNLDKCLKGATYTIYKANEDGSIGEKVADIITEGDKGQGSYGIKEEGTYIVKESNPPEGYEISDEEFVINVEKQEYVELNEDGTYTKGWTLVVSGYNSETEDVLIVSDEPVKVVGDNSSEDSSSDGKTDSGVIETSDSSNIVLWSVMAGISLLMFALVLALRKRNHIGE